jgi:mannitol PTS system EIICBA or EIICB component
MKLQQIGRFLSTIVFQNISGLIALGMIRVFFSPSGWWPNPHIYQVVNPMLQYFIPVLFAYSGGRIIGGKRGGVISSFVTIAMAAGNNTSYTLILPAMAIGPLIGYLIAKIDKWLENRIPVGFELLIYNMAAGLIGVCFAIFGLIFVNPLINKGVELIFTGDTLLTKSGLLPLVALIIEPSKVLFFNNVINHGILEPLGIQQTKEFGKSIFFLLESNPGPGFGLLLAYFVRLKGKKKAAVKSSLVIQVLGGIHEVYFPYALMNPWVIIPLIFGGMAGDLIFYLLKAGLVATPSPGSLFIILMMAPKGNFMAVIAGFLLSALVSFLGSLYVLSQEKVVEELMTQPYQQDMLIQPVENSHQAMPIKKIIFACDAGYGSSAMGAAMLRKKFKQANLGIPVNHASVDEIPRDADLVITQIQLTQRASKMAPHAEHLSISSFDEDTFYEDLIARLKSQKDNNERKEVANEMELTEDHILLDMEAKDKWEAIEQIGYALVARGNVERQYIEEMKQREQVVSTYLGNGVAIPHGIDVNSPRVKKPGIAIAQYPKGINFGNGKTAYLLIALAGQGPQHLSVLSELAEMIESRQKVNQLLFSKSPEEMIRLIHDSGLFYFEEIAEANRS